jgi:hypothetical protein
MARALLRLTVGFLSGAATAGLSAAFLAVAIGALSPAISAVGLGLGVVVGWRATRAVPEIALEPMSRASAFAVAVFVAACARQFLAVCFEANGMLLTQLPNNYGDLPLHWTYVSFFARGPSFWPVNPIAAGDRLRYPLGVDLLTAMLVQMGIGMPTLLRAMGLLAGLLAAYALYLWGRGFATAAFLFSGGWAGLHFTARGWPTDSPDALAWKNLFLALFVPQRGLLFALPAGLLLLWSWRRRWLRAETGLPPWTLGLLWGALPIFHLHTFVFVSMIAAVWALAARRVREALPVLGYAFLPAAWGAFEVTDRFRAAALVWWKAGWVMGPQAPVALFLASNFGFWLLAVPAAVVLAARRRDREGLLTLVPGLLLFGLLFFLMLAPWDWDNTKVMVWSFLLVLPATFELALRRLPIAARAAAIVLLVLPGVVSVVRTALPPPFQYVVADVLELREVCAAVRALPTGVRVATSQTFNHPIALCGQPIVAGYEGHLWSHGIPREPLESRLAAVMEGRPEWSDAARELGAGAIFWGPREAAAFPTSTRAWETVARQIAAGRWGRLYRLD